MARSQPVRPLSVAALVDLHRHAASGGHVKSWERLAEAAADVPGDVDLTVYVLGDRESVDPVAPNARFVSLRPLLGTRRLQWFAAGTDATDLAPYHPRLAALLPRHDVWQATHTFAFGATARRLAAANGRPLVVSLQTDLPAFVRLYVRELVHRTLFRTPVASLLLDGAHIDGLAARVARRSTDRLVRASRHVLASNDEDEAYAQNLLGPRRVSRLRRGVDLSAFHPDRRDRAWLEQAYGVPPDQPVVLFAGRVDATKGALRVARAVRRLRDRGRPAHLFVAGEGGQADRVRRLLGSGVTLPGSLPQDELARVYASCDVFAFPSTSETIGNVVVEAMASGLPVLLRAGTATIQWLDRPGHDGLVVEGDRDQDWAEALDRVLADETGRRRLAAAARRTTERRRPTWEDVLREDLLPVWLRSAGRLTRAAERVVA